MCAKLSQSFITQLMLLLKVTVMKIEKALINNRSRVSKVS